MTDNRPTLSPADAAALDALLEAGHRPAAATPAASTLDDRTVRLQGWLHLLDATPTPEAPADLLDRTLARIQSERMKFTNTPATASNSSAFSIQHSTSTASAASTGATVAAPRSNFRRYLADIAAMAVAASVFGIVVSLGVFQARQSAKRVACATNLQAVGTAFASYAADYANALPSLGNSADHNWLVANPTTPNDHTNADNLSLLLNAKLLTAENLICAGRDISHPDPVARTALLPIPENVRSYSYVNMFSPVHPSYDGNHNTILLADRSPLFDPQSSPDPQANSTNHAGNGNYLLRADKSVTWELSPNVGYHHDNIWTVGPTPQYPCHYVGTEVPTRASDTFLSP